MNRANGHHLLQDDCNKDGGDETDAEEGLEESDDA